MREFSEAADYMKDLEERTLNSNETSLELLKKLREHELENATLKNYIIDLKARIAVYIP